MVWDFRVSVMHFRLSSGLNDGPSTKKPDAVNNDISLMAVGAHMLESWLMLLCDSQCCYRGACLILATVPSQS